MDNTSAILDFLAQEYGADDATTRAKLLRWLQVAVAEVWGAADWWWKREEISFSFTAGTAVYTLPVLTEGIISVFDGDGSPVLYVPLETWDQVYRASAVTEVNPLVWTVTSRDMGTGALIFRVWPIPSAGTMGRMVRRVRDVALADSALNRSRVPVDFVHVPAYRALELMHSHESQQDKAERYRQRYEQGMQQLVQENQRRKREGG